MPKHPAWFWKDPLSIAQDVLWNSSADTIRDPAFAVIDALQRFPPGVQIEATFAAAAIMARAVGLDPHEMVSRAKRQVEDIEAVETAASSIADYAKGELNQ